MAWTEADVLANNLQKLWSSAYIVTHSVHVYVQEVQLGAEANQGYSLIRLTSHLSAL